jgi:methylmalonyl-CoA/ethylmalonyl-CoA epimerase
MAQADPQLEAIGQIAINVHDIDRARAFYRDTLGLPHLFDAGPKLCFFGCGAVRLMLGLPDKPEFDHPSSVLYFKVDGIESVHARLSAKGALFEGPPHLVAPMPDHDLWMAFFRDSEGNLLALMDEKRRA